MFVHVTDAKHVKGHRVHVWFNDGTNARIDLSKSLDGPIFRPVRRGMSDRAAKPIRFGYTTRWNGRHGSMHEFPKLGALQ